MYRMLCVLAVLTLQAGLARCFSWDIVSATSNRLEFNNEEKLTYFLTFIDVQMHWVTYDPLHNRVLLRNSTKALLSFDIATEKIQTLIDLKPVPVRNDHAYDPATGLLFAFCGSNKIYSYLVKPGSNHKVDGKFVIDLGEWCYALAVDSCGGYIYWIIGTSNTIERARFNGSEREVVIESSDTNRFGLTIDPQTQNMYWTEYERHSNQYFILSADLNGKHRRTLHHGRNLMPVRLTVSKDSIYWTAAYRLNKFWKFPKNLRIGTDVEPKGMSFDGTSSDSGERYIAANYAIEEPLQGNPRCEALKPQLPNDSANNDSDSLNVSTEGSLLRVNETKVNIESRINGDTSDLSLCHNYCLQGNCSVSAEGLPKCRCNAGFVGVRCEVNECYTYCLNDGVCSLSEQNNPVCQCTRGYQGERCDVPDFLLKCSQAVSIFKNILNADLTSVTERKGVNSTCTSTVV